MGSSGITKIAEQIDLAARKFGKPRRFKFRNCEAIIFHCSSFGAQTVLCFCSGDTVSFVTASICSVRFENFAMVRSENFCHIPIFSCSFDLISQGGWRSCEPAVKGSLEVTRIPLLGPESTGFPTMVNGIKARITVRPRQCACEDPFAASALVIGTIRSTGASLFAELRIGTRSDQTPEIGAAALAGAGQVINKFGSFIRPAVHPVLSDFSATHANQAAKPGERWPTFRLIIP